jgi:hypothetical protein
MNKLQLIKANLKELKQYIVDENELNNWDKIIIIYNFYIFFSNLYVAYYLINLLSKDNNNIVIQFRNVYLFFYILCSIRTTYLYLIKNICKINIKLGISLYNNSCNYFM